MNARLDALTPEAWEAALEEVQPQIMALPAKLRERINSKGTQNSPVLRTIVFRHLGKGTGTRQPWKDGEFPSDVPTGVRMYPSEVRELVEKSENEAQG